MARELTAILLETRSIQKYVFGCNQLKTNTGASFLVDNIFTGVMQDGCYARGAAEQWIENACKRLA